MKRCSQCGGRLPLGVRFRNYWGHWHWVHKRFCSRLCESLFDQESHIAKEQKRWHAFLDTSVSQAQYMRSRYDP